jgi:hypothetical protein
MRKTGAASIAIEQSCCNSLLENSHEMDDYALLPLDHVRNSMRTLFQAPEIPRYL